MDEKLNPKEMVVVELEVDQFGPFDNPQWTSGVFVVPRAKAAVIQKYFTDLAVSYGEQKVVQSGEELIPVMHYKDSLSIKIRPIIPTPLEVYDHYIHTFENNGALLYVPGWKVQKNYGIWDGAMSVGFSTLEQVGRAARMGLIPANIRLNEAREMARWLDEEGKLGWGEDMLQ